VPRNGPLINLILTSGALANNQIRATFSVIASIVHVRVKICSKMSKLFSSGSGGMNNIIANNSELSSMTDFENLFIA